MLFEKTPGDLLTALAKMNFPVMEETAPSKYVTHVFLKILLMNFYAEYFWYLF